MIRLLSSCSDIDINCLDDKSRSPLILLTQKLAADANNDDILDAIRLLLQNGADVNQRCKDGRTALHYIFTADITQVVLVAVRLLLEYHAELAIKDVNGQTVIDLAFQIWQDNKVNYTQIQDATETMKRIVKKMSDDQIGNHLANGMLPLTVAVVAMNESLIEVLLDCNADVDHETRDNYRETALQTLCAYNCKPTIVERFISRSKKLFAQYGESKKGLLHIACSHGNDEIVRQLLLARLNTEARNVSGSTPLHFAARNGHTSTIELLLENGANVFAKNNTGWNVTHVTAFVGSEGVCEILLRAGANWTEESVSELGGVQYQGVTPLHIAACRGHISVVNFLLENKLANDINVGAGLDRAATPLHLASANAGASMEKFLLSRGASVHALDGFTSSTPLHYVAARYVSPESKNIARALLEKGADEKKVDSNGFTPESLAFHKGNKVVGLFLHEYQRTKAEPEPTKSSASNSAQSCSPTNNGPVLASEPLLTAIRIGDLDVLNRLIGEGVQTSGVAECGCTPLVLSCFYGHYTLSHSLVENGADLYGQTCGSKSTAGYQAVHYAACFGGAKLLSILLKMGAPLSHGGIEPFHLAAANGHVDCLKLLLDHESSTSSPRRLLDILVDIDTLFIKNRGRGSKENKKATALHLASAEGSESCLSFLIKEGANTEAIDTSCCTPLHVAVVSGNVGAVKLILAEGANVNCRDKAGATPMHYAARFGYLEILTALHISDAEITARDISGRSPTHLAAIEANTQIVEYLINHGANLHSSDHCGYSTLHYMLCRGSQEMQEIAVNHLVDIGTTVHPIDGTILNMACASGEIFSVKALLKRIPQRTAAQYVDYPCKLGTPLYSAALIGNLEVMEVLIDAGASLDLVGGEYGPPLHVACAMGRVEAVRFLLDRGAKRNYVGENGKIISAMDAAVHQKHIQALLESWRRLE